jgi:hypothetical protein
MYTLAGQRKVALYLQHSSLNVPDHQRVKRLSRYTNKHGTPPASRYTFGHAIGGGVAAVKFRIKEVSTWYRSGWN